MTVPPKKLWKAAASGGDPQLAIDDRYATAWTPDEVEKPWLEIDLGAVATLGGLEIYWGRRAAAQYEFHTSLMARPGSASAAPGKAKVDRSCSAFLPQRPACALERG